MKVKNIAFSGFMAAIMLSAGATAANAKIEIASRQYVDNIDKTTTEKITNLTTTVEGKADKTTVNELQQNVTNLTTTIDGKADAADLDGYLKSADAETTYAKKDAVTGVENTANAAKEAADAAQTTANANKTAIGDAESGLTKGVADATQAAADAAAAAAAADTKAGNAATAASAAQATADQNKTDLTALTGRVSTNETNISNINTKVGEGDLTTDAKTIVGAINEINNDVYRKVDTYTKAQVNTLIGDIQAGDVDLKGYVKETTYQEGMATKANKLTVDAANAGNIATVDANGQYQVSDKKLTDFTSMADVTGAITNALTTGDIKDALDAKADAATVNTELAKKANADDVYDKKAVDDKFDTTIPKPEGSCAAESGRCVLSVDAASKNMMWMDVTAPLGEE